MWGVKSCGNVATSFLLDINYLLDSAYVEKAKSCEINISKKDFFSSISYFNIKKEKAIIVCP